MASFTNYTTLITCCLTDEQIVNSSGYSEVRTHLYNVLGLARDFSECVIINYARRAGDGTEGKPVIVTFCSQQDINVIFESAKYKKSSNSIRRDRHLTMRRAQKKVGEGLGTLKQWTKEAKIVREP